jgi:RNA polymerase sigma-70 factor (ECF subfamily)
MGGAGDAGAREGGESTMSSHRYASTTAVRPYLEVHPGGRRHGRPDERLHTITQAVRGLRILALRWSRGRDEAEDLMQDTAERALRNLDRYHPGTSATAWVRAIMYHLAIDESRQRCRRAVVHQAYGHQVDLDGQEEPQSEPAPVPDLAQVRATVEQLDEPFRATFRLWAVERRSYREIGAILGVPLGTVATRLKRSREQVRRLLQAAAPPADQRRWGPGPM